MSEADYQEFQGCDDVDPGIKEHYCPKCGTTYECQNSSCTLPRNFTCGECHHILAGGGEDPA